MTQFDQRWQMVTCSGCGRHYRCTPTDDYYNCSNDHDGVCETCLLAPHGLTTTDVQELGVVVHGGEDR